MSANKENVMAAATEIITHGSNQVRIVLDAIQSLSNKVDLVSAQLRALERLYENN